ARARSRGATSRGFRTRRGSGAPSAPRAFYARRWKGCRNSGAVARGTAARFARPRCKSSVTCFANSPPHSGGLLQRLLTGEAELLRAVVARIIPATVLEVYLAQPRGFAAEFELLFQTSQQELFELVEVRGAVDDHG